MCRIMDHVLVGGLVCMAVKALLFWEFFEVLVLGGFLKIL